jgi:hypothetical protein
MAVVITPEITKSLEEFQKSLHTVDDLVGIFCDARPDVDAERYQSLFHNSMANLLERFDALCEAIGLPNWGVAMAKNYSSNTHVFFSAFDNVCLFWGPPLEGNKYIAKVLCRDVRTVKDWRSGREPCPRWAYELLRLVKDERRRLLEDMVGAHRSSAKSLRFAGTRLSVALAERYGNRSANDQFRLVDLPDAAEQHWGLFRRPMRRFFGLIGPSTLSLL